MGSFLVVANQTLGGEALAAHLRRVIETDPAARFVVVAPLSSQMPVDVGGAMGVMGGVTVIDQATHDQMGSAARQRLSTLLEWFRGAGVEAEGTVVGDPMPAMEAAVASEPFDEIIISTLPARVSQWLRLDLVHRASRRFDIPITTVTAADDTLPSVAPAAAVAKPTTTATSVDPSPKGKRDAVPESVYKIIELVGTSTESWEKAASAAVAKASRTLRDMRIAEIAELDLVIDDGAVSAYRAKIKVSFKYEGDD
jgi:flavin-binding protein dodecin